MKNPTLISRRVIYGARKEHFCDAHLFFDICDQDEIKNINLISHAIKQKRIIQGGSYVRYVYKENGKAYTFKIRLFLDHTFSHFFPGYEIDLARLVADKVFFQNEKIQ